MSKIPYDEIDHIEFPEKNFCFTGTCSYGKRKKCKEAVINVGSTVHEHVLKNTNYLVVGAKGINRGNCGIYSKKVAKALRNKKEGRAIFIVEENKWVEALQREQL